MKNPVPARTKFYILMYSLAAIFAIIGLLVNIKTVPLNENMRVLSFLPLCHIFERVVVYTYIVRGVSVYYAESMETIADNLKEVKPHFVTSVPRLLEKVYIKLQGAAANLDGWKKNLYANALDFAQNFDVEKEYGFMDNLKRKVYDKLIYKKWREALGGECMGICTGAAALNPLLARVFTCAGIPIMEGYGQTESSPVISINPFSLERIKFGTVGVVISGVEVKLDHREGMGEGEGEICCDLRVNPWLHGQGIRDARAGCLAGAACDESRAVLGLNCPLSASLRRRCRCRRDRS